MSQADEVLVVIRSDVSGEDQAYTIGAVRIPRSRADVFAPYVLHVRDELRERLGDEYEDEHLLRRLEADGYKVVETPLEVVIN